MAVGGVGLFLKPDPNKMVFSLVSGRKSDRLNLKIISETAKPTTKKNETKKSIFTKFLNRDKLEARTYLI